MKCNGYEARLRSLSYVFNFGGLNRCATFIIQKHSYHCELTGERPIYFFSHNFWTKTKACARSAQFLSFLTVAGFQSQSPLQFSVIIAQGFIDYTFSSCIPWSWCVCLIFKPEGPAAISGLTVPPALLASPKSAHSRIKTNTAGIHV